MKFSLPRLAVLAILMAGFSLACPAQTTHTVKLSWIAPTKDANGGTLPTTGAGSVTGYNVKRSVTLAGPFATISTAQVGTTYTDAALPGSCSSGCTIYYEVTAINAGGEGAPLGPSSGVVPSSAIPVPAAPNTFVITIQ